MRLTELDSEWLSHPYRNADGRWVFTMLPSIRCADGVWFLCPVCFKANGGRVGTHHVLCWSPRVSQAHFPKPGRWQLVGTSFEDLTLVAGSSSVLLHADCKAHFYIRDGEILLC